MRYDEIVAHLALNGHEISASAKDDDRLCLNILIAYDNCLRDLDKLDKLVRTYQSKQFKATLVEHDLA